MGLSYDPGARKWNLVYEKTDYKTNYKTDYPTDLPTNLKTDYPEKESRRVSTGGKGGYYAVVPNQQNIALNQQNITLNQQNKENNKINAATNEANKKLNTDYTALNQANTAKNTAYDKTLATANSTLGGDYAAQRGVIRNVQGIDKITKKTLEDYYKSFYTTEKLQTWDANLGAKPPYGKFDPTYYKEQNPAILQAWQKAVANDDIDITQRYGENNFYLQHYTTTGKNQGLRANKAEILEASKNYIEKKPTDADLNAARTLQLGVDIGTQTNRLLNVPEIAAEWEKAKKDDSYWKQLGKEYFLDVKKPDEFAALFRLSKRPKDQQIAFNYNVNVGYGITELEDALNTAVGEKAIVDVKKFGALAQDTLKATIEQMKKAKAKEQELSIFSGFSGFNEVVGINKELTNSILGDSGIGGILSFIGGNKAEESLEKSLQKITGVNNSITYNWQNWFDTQLKQKYQDDLELGLTTEEAKENVKIQGEFAREFIDKYLIPRFNESRSMNEFVDYLDVRQSEQNPFQTQDILNAVKLVADIRAEQFLDQVKKTPDRYFDAEFYFNPTGNKARAQDYITQAQSVSADWEAAKKGDAYWQQQAYRFGVDINDKDAFGRMHFQVKGQGRGYDAADDILNAGKVSDYIYNQILPALKDEALKQGTIFGQFIKPSEFADEMLKGVDPNNKKSWDEVLDQFGLKDFSGTINDLKQYIAETLQTGSAQKIREQIKYLNEKREKPTQQNLGVTYIQRDEDYKPTEKLSSDTELYKVFQSAGFQGTEDEFYNNFFPDIDRSEQEFLTKAGKNETLKTTGLNLSDPFASLGTLQNFFGEDDTYETKNKYLTINEDEDSFLPKTKSGQGFLDEFTSLFK
jgi:hypothetical protein